MSNPPIFNVFQSNLPPTWVHVLCDFRQYLCNEHSSSDIIWMRKSARTTICHMDAHISYGCANLPGQQYAIWMRIYHTDAQICLDNNVHGQQYAICNPPAFPPLHGQRYASKNKKSIPCKKYTGACRFHTLEQARHTHLSRRDTHT